MLTRKAVERCAKDHEGLKLYIKNRLFKDHVSILQHIVPSKGNANNNTDQLPAHQYVASFTFTVHPSDNLWINEKIIVEVKVTTMYPADPPEVYFKNEFSARSLIHRSSSSSLTVSDSETGEVSSKLLTRDGWNRSYDFCCVYHSVKRFFEIPQAEILDGAIYQRYMNMLSPSNEQTVAWKVKMASHELQGKRRTMEDQISLIGNILNYEAPSFNSSNGELFSPLRFAAVFDGHGGAGASKYFANELPPVVCTEICHGNLRTPRAVLSSFSKCDKRFLGSKGTASSHDVDGGLFNGISPDPSGTTCSCVLIDRVGRCIISNVGDSRTILCRADGKALELTRDHKASSPDEVARIVDMGGFVANNRLMGQIAVARALGDRHFKTNGSTSSLSCEPDVTVCQLNDGDEFFLLACDGLFDVCTSQEAVDVCRQFLSANGNDIVLVSKLMAEYAIANGSTDNVSVAIILVEKVTSFHSQNLKNISQIYNTDGTIKENNANVYNRNNLEKERKNEGNSSSRRNKPFVVDEDDYDYVSRDNYTNGSISPLMIGSEEWDGDDNYKDDYNYNDDNNRNSALNEIDQLLNETDLINSPKKSAVNHNKTRVQIPSTDKANASDSVASSTKTKKKYNDKNKALLGLDDDTLDFLMDSNNFDD